MVIIGLHWGRLFLGILGAFLGMLRARVGHRGQYSEKVHVIASLYYQPVSIQNFSALSNRESAEKKGLLHGSKLLNILKLQNKSTNERILFSPQPSIFPKSTKNVPFSGVS
jgi:hypothetical protein